MEPNKLETQIKEQLNAREIQPSEMAWDRLDAMLTVAEEKKQHVLVSFRFNLLELLPAFWYWCRLVCFSSIKKKPLLNQKIMW